MTVTPFANAPQSTHSTGAALRPNSVEHRTKFHVDRDRCHLDKQRLPPTITPRLFGGGREALSDTLVPYRCNSRAKSQLQWRCLKIPPKPPSWENASSAKAFTRMIASIVERSSRTSSSSYRVSESSGRRRLLQNAGLS